MRILKVNLQKIRKFTLWILFFFFRVISKAFKKSHFIKKNLFLNILTSLKDLLKASQFIAVKNAANKTGLFFLVHLNRGFLGFFKSIIPDWRHIVSQRLELKFQFSYWVNSSRKISSDLPPFPSSGWLSSVFSLLWKIVAMSCIPGEWGWFKLLNNPLSPSCLRFMLFPLLSPLKLRFLQSKVNKHWTRLPSFVKWYFSAVKC